MTERASYGGAATQVVQHEYDVYNRLVHKELDADGAGAGGFSDTFWTYDGDNPILEFDGDTAGDLAHRYLWGPAVDQLLADENVDDGGAEDVLWPLTDWQGTVRDVATYNASTNVTTIANHKVYEAFGKVYSESAPAVDTIFGYTARYFDDDTGLQWNLNRWYDAGVGRWLSEDPIGFAGGDPNLYRYVSSSPGMYTDPSGLAEWDRRPHESHEEHCLRMRDDAKNSTDWYIWDEAYRYAHAERNNTRPEEAEYRKMLERSLAGHTPIMSPGSSLDTLAQWLFIRPQRITSNVISDRTGFDREMQIDVAAIMLSSKPMYTCDPRTAPNRDQATTLWFHATDPMTYVLLGTGAAAETRATAALFGGVSRCFEEIPWAMRAGVVTQARGVPCIVAPSAQMPTVEFCASRCPGLAENIYHAQMAGHPRVLTYGGEIAANRAAALEGVPNIVGLSRDEYPFASVLEGGRGSWIGHIAPSEQSSQGGILKNFYQQNNIQPGTRFRVTVKR